MDMRLLDLNIHSLELATSREDTIDCFDDFERTQQLRQNATAEELRKLAFTVEAKLVDPEMEIHEALIP